ncbi:M48 family metalloprotease [Candidatus Marsarchaeota archaeon]|nr:M48 family metalloprotease [Candidatus Marsarchaeota archaeon]
MDESSKKHSSGKPANMSIPFELLAGSLASFAIALILLGILFYIAYQVWPVLFYALFSMFAAGLAFQSFSKPNGKVLSKSKDRAVFEFVNGVAASMKMKRIDKIILTPDTNIGIVGIFEHKLLLGIAAIDALPKEYLYAILFHEFAHFRGWDNIIGSLLIRINMSLKTIIAIVSRITIIGFIIGMFLAVFNAVYSIIILFYSRQREFLADYIAAEFVGGGDFGSALSDYSKFSNQFNIKVNAILNYYFSQKLAPNNIYETARKAQVNFDDETKKRIEDSIKKSNERTSLLSTHPALKSRLERISHVQGAITRFPKGACRDMFLDFDAYEEELTRISYSSMSIKLRQGK